MSRGYTVHKNEYQGMNADQIYADLRTNTLPQLNQLGRDIKAMVDGPEKDAVIVEQKKLLYKKIRTYAKLRKMGFHARKEKVSKDVVETEAPSLLPEDNITEVKPNE